MTVVASPILSPVPAPQRARGEARLSARRHGEVSRLGEFRQGGSLKVLFPRGVGPALEAVLLNTAGGLTSGDRMRIAARAEAGARLVLTTQAAERGYRAAGDPPAEVETRLAVEEGGRVDWLPQETILFDGARLRRRLLVDLEGMAACLLVEPVLFGRLARGEEVREGAFSDRWEVRRNGRLLFADALRLESDMAAALDRPGVAGGARAMASVMLAGAGAEALLPKVRALLPPEGGASLVEDGVLFARLAAADGFALRKTLLPLITILTGMALPKVWRL